MSTKNSNPIFILGMTRRSGTNFLAQLLTLHPDLEATNFVFEDYMLSEARWLFHFAHRVYERWNPAWEVDPDRKTLLVQHLGQGIISCLESMSQSKRLVTRTPCVENLSHFFDLFPNAYLLILVRDGRNVVESMVRSFESGYEQATREWVAAAQTIVDFDQNHHQKNLKYLIVRYEDLVLDLDAQLRTIFEFLDIDVTTYNFDAAYQLPVFGSSTSQDKKEKEWRWKTAAKTPEFQPLKRWKNWSPYRRQRFHWLAGCLMIQLSYEEKEDQRLWIFYNHLIDLAWPMTKKFSGLIPKSVKRDLKSRQWA